ncbi:MAG: alginate export family protein [Acidobacteriota bacterium]
MTHRSIRVAGLCALTAALLAPAATATAQSTAAGGTLASSAGPSSAIATSIAATSGTQATPPTPPPAPSAARSAALMPKWLQVHVEQRTRYETVDARYRPTEVGGDQQLDFRERLQVRASTSRAWLFGEVQDTRASLVDSASTVGASAVTKTKVVQLHAGYAWRDLGAHKTTLQIEAGRISRDLGSRRLLSRNLYSNSTNAYDGAIARAAGKTWSLTALAIRPLFYTYPKVARDPRYDKLVMSGLYFTSTRKRAANADLYALIWNDGSGVATATRRKLNTFGGRLFGQFGPERRAEYETELTWQGGSVGPRDHRAWMQHGQVGYNFPKARWKPRVLAVWDYASGDADPTDDTNGTFDSLYGDRRFEFGPLGLYGLIARANLVSPGAWVIVKPTAPLETWLQVRGLWLAQARDRWRAVGIGDATGQAGRHVGTQVEWRARYRFTPHFDFDGGVTLFDESHFVEVLRPSPHGHAVYMYAGIELKY